MATKMASNQIDLTPANTPSLGLHVHAPAGLSASSANNPSDAPSVPSKSNSPAGGKAVQVTIQGTPGQAVRFCNPS